MENFRKDRCSDNHKVYTAISVADEPLVPPLQKEFFKNLTIFKRKNHFPACTPATKNRFVPLLQKFVRHSAKSIPFLL